MSKTLPPTMKRLKTIIKKKLAEIATVRRAATRVIAAHEAVIHAHRDLGLTHAHDVHDDGQTDAEWCSYMDHRS